MGGVVRWKYLKEVGLVGNVKPKWIYQGVIFVPVTLQVEGSCLVKVLRYQKKKKLRFKFFFLKKKNLSITSRENKKFKLMTFVS